MKLKIFLLLVSFTLVGTGVWLKIEERQEIIASVEAHKRRWMPDFDLNNVSEIFIKTNTESLLIKKNAEVWKISDPSSQNANIVTVGQLVQRLKNLKPSEEIDAGRSQFGNFELLEPDGFSSGTGTLVELRDKNSQRIAAIILGKQSFSRPDPKSPFPPPPNGRFFKPLDSNGPIGVVAEGFDSISPKIDVWAEGRAKP